MSVKSSKKQVWVPLREPGVPAPPAGDSSPAPAPSGEATIATHRPVTPATRDPCGLPGRGYRTRGGVKPTPERWKVQEEVDPRDGGPVEIEG